MSVVTSFFKNKLVLFTLVAYGLTAVAATEKLMLAFMNSLYYLREMLFVMPVIFMLTVLIDVWIKRDMIIKHLGKSSGARGIAFSVFLGSLSAGPIYAAFPICKMLLAKGASVANIVVILSSWAVIKIPMLANEVRFLGVKFMALRWVLTVLVIYVIARIMSFLVKEDELKIDQLRDHDENQKHMEAIGVNEVVCIGCGICAKAMPDVFVMAHKKAIVLPRAMMRDELKDVQGLCPVGAIVLPL